MRIFLPIPLLLLILLISCQPTASEKSVGSQLEDNDQLSTLVDLLDPAKAPFYFGLASGDPLPDAVILWTKVLPDSSGPIEVRWEVAADSLFSEIRQKGTTRAVPENGYTVKIDVKGLSPNTSYYYRFSALGRRSPVGRTRTAPEIGSPVDSIRLAVVSCSNYEAGYFNAYRALARERDLAAVLHLGDYIYEYAVGVYGDTSLGRTHLPSHEIVSLDDYRIRYGQYRLDEDLQEVHRLHPFITIWDDHEITNNAYVAGAQNHQPGEGNYEDRKAAARQAYYEWLPVRDKLSGELYRQLSFGLLADLFMLDERLAGRTSQADSLSQPGFADSTRTMLGKEQRQWLLGNLAASEAQWKIIGNQVIFSDLNFEGIIPGWQINLDAWDGYPFEKKQILNFLEQNSIENTIFVTGDSHCSWAFEVPAGQQAYRERGSEAALAVEFGATSITSSNYDERVGMDTVAMLTNMYRAPERNPHLKYVDLAQHGFLLLKLTQEKATAEWHYVSTIREARAKTSVGKRFSVKTGSHQLVE